MNKAKRTFYILIAVNILLIGGIIGVYFFASKFAKQKSQEIAIVKADIETNDQSLNSYRELERSLSKSTELSAIAKEVLPQDKNQSVALQEINQFAEESGISIKQVTFTTPNTTKKTTGPTLTSPSNLKGVSVLSVSVKAEKMQYDQLLTLLKKFEDNRRRMQVTSISLAPSTTKLGQLDRADLSVDVYLKP
jgi:hypothetical protein